MQYNIYNFLMNGCGDRQITGCSRNYESNFRHTSCYAVGSEFKKLYMLYCK